MLTVQNLSYIHPNKELLFENISFSISNNNKVALIGKNGVGKSTLLRILVGNIQASVGKVDTVATPYLVPQHFGQFNDYTIAKALQIDDKLKALHETLNGNATEENLSLIGEDWTIEERSLEALAYWNLQGLSLMQKMDSLSGGEKTKIFLAGITIHNKEIVLLDEPTNHLDLQTREILYNYIKSCSNTVLLVSHDIFLLRLLNSVYELDQRGITLYGGNYDFYINQKINEENALQQEIKNKDKSLRKSIKIEREATERKQKLDARGKKKQEKAGAPRIAKKTLKDKAEKSSTRLKDTHSGKIETLTAELHQIRKKVPDTYKMKMDFESSKLHLGKILVSAKGINYGYNNQYLWDQPLSFEIRSGARISIKGQNGSGKTTLLKIILGEIQPQIGSMDQANINAIYIDQDYTLINQNHTVYEQAWSYNQEALHEHEVKMRLNRFLFDKESWIKPCSALSGGEKMRLLLCCLMISNQSPDLFVLDEPTNNLDIENSEILTQAVQEYKGTVLVVSHDEYFLNEINIQRVIKVV